VGDQALKLGYELFDIRVASEIGHPKFGLLFDLGHASRLRPDVDTSDVLDMMDLSATQIVQFHAHGVGGKDKTDHLPFSQNTYLDYDRIVKHIKGLGLIGPLILEIGIRREDWEQNLEDCLSARNELVRAWQDAQ
jgi:sugar phosphate isomerase/epimerase